MSQCRDNGKVWFSPCKAEETQKMSMSSNRSSERKDTIRKLDGVLGTQTSRLLLSYYSSR